MCGMTEKEFRHSTMRDINLRLKAYKQEKEYKEKEIEYKSWLTGFYVQCAISSCFSKKAKYPENPLKQKVVVENMDLTEEEKERYRREFLERLQRMEKKFNKEKSKNGSGN